MANIVYFLGAGASAQAIPTVADSMCRFEIFSIFLNAKATSAVFESDDTESKVKAKLSEYETLLHACQEHLSFDTLAKKLYLQQEYPKLHSLKEFLSLYYIFEHYTSQDFVTVIDEYRSQLEYRTELEIDELAEKALRFHLNPIDFRYDAFIAGISDNQLIHRLFIPKNVSIISWNYDLQMEFALNEYDRFESRRLDFMFNPIDYKNSVIKFEFSNEYIKLNGCAGYILENNKSLQRTELEINSKLEILEMPLDHGEDIFDFLFDTIERFVKNRNINEFRPYINFAWEDNELSNCTVGRAKSKIDAADSIVVIGYSFPTFNREVDAHLFSNIELGRGCKIYIQAVNENEFSKVKTRIQGIANSLNDSDFEFIDDVSQFYVPFEFSKQVSKPYAS